MDIAEKLEQINQTLEKILGVMQKPKKRFTQILERLVLFAGSLAILNAADVVRSWIFSHSCD